MSRITVLLLVALTLGLTACSKAPPAPLGFTSRDQFTAYVDGIDMPDAWKEAVKQETGRVSGKYLNNMKTYLKLEGEPVVALLKKYGMKADVSFDGVDPAPAVKAAVDDLIRAGDAKNIYKNDYWLTHEELGNGAWEEGKSAFQQAGEFSRQRGDRKRALDSQPDFGDVRDR